MVHIIECLVRVSVCFRFCIYATRYLGTLSDGFESTCLTNGFQTWLMKNWFGQSVGQFIVRSKAYAVFHNQKQKKERFSY